MEQLAGTAGGVLGYLEGALFLSIELHLNDADRASLARALQRIRHEDGDGALPPLLGLAQMRHDSQHVVDARNRHR